MRLNQEDVRAGYMWLCGSSVALVCLIAFLIFVDSFLTHNPREAWLGATLKELRGAQSSLSSGVTDSRQSYSPPKRALEVIAPLSEENGHSDSHH